MKWLRLLVCFAPCVRKYGPNQHWQSIIMHAELQTFMLTPTLSTKHLPVLKGLLPPAARTASQLTATTFPVIPDLAGKALQYVHSQLFLVL